MTPQNFENTKINLYFIYELKSKTAKLVVENHYSVRLDLLIVTNVEQNNYLILILYRLFRTLVLPQPRRHNFSLSHDFSRLPTIRKSESRTVTAYNRINI